MNVVTEILNNRRNKIQYGTGLKL